MLKAESWCTGGVHFSMESLSTYALSLPAEAKKRYLEKISVIEGRDPFADGFGESTNAIPSVSAGDLVSYLMLQISFLTAKEFKAHKSLESYNQFVCGWIRAVNIWNKFGKFIITGQVSEIIAIFIIKVE